MAGVGDLEKDLRWAMESLALDVPDRFPGTRGHQRAFTFLERALKAEGLWVRAQPFLSGLQVAKKWKVELDLGRGWETVESWPGLGSPAVKDLVGEVIPVGHAREEDYQADVRYGGKVHLARLWKSHETAKVRAAAFRGATALIWYNDFIDELYSGACDYRLAPIPGFSLKKSLAQRVEQAGGARVRINLKSTWKRIRCRNILAGRGPAAGPYAILASHYDTRPYTPGASDDASGVAVMVAFIRAGLDRGLKTPLRFLFADNEEAGCVGAETHAEGLSRTGELGRLTCLANLDAVGWPNLCVITRDREAVLDEGLSLLARDVLEGEGYRPELSRSKTGKSNQTPFALRGVRTVWFSDYPNYIRHSPIDNPFNIDYPTMALVTRALRPFFERA